VCRWLVYEDVKHVTSPDAVARVRRALADVSRADVGGGTVGNFAEANRDRAAAAAMGVLSFPINPQAHATDDLSLIENLEGQAPTVLTARQFAPGARIAVGPVTLHRRPDPFAAGKRGGDAKVVAGDERQNTLFGAAWTVGSLAALIKADADSLTYFETMGPFGVMDESAVFPLYHVLADVAEYVGGQVLASDQPSLRTCAALALGRDERVRVIVANTQGMPVSMRLGGLKGYRLIGRLDLNEGTLREATTAPQEFRAAAGVGAGGDVPPALELSPYAVVRLDLAKKQ
jgi:hypothetical protein